MREQSDDSFSSLAATNRELVLLSSALITKNNDIHSLHDFVGDAINGLSNADLKDRMHNLNERVMNCHSDDERLRFVALMQYTLAENALPNVNKDQRNKFKALSVSLEDLNKAKGDELRARVGSFHVDILGFVHEVEDMGALGERAVEVLNTKGKALVGKINALFDGINDLIQPSYDDLFHD